MTLGRLNWLEIRPQFHKTRKINRPVGPSSGIHQTSQSNIHMTCSPFRLSIVTQYHRHVEAIWEFGEQQRVKQGRARARVVPDEIVRERQSHACELNYE